MDALRRTDGTWFQISEAERSRLDAVPDLCMGIANYGRRTRAKKEKEVEQTTPILPTPVCAENVITGEAA